MILIGIDTTGKNGSLTLARAAEDAVASMGTSSSATSVEAAEIVETVALEGGTFSAQLIPQLADLLKRHGLSKKDVGGFAVASGPGSFTGLRVGLAAVKGLAEVLGQPVVALSMLEVMAWASRETGRVIAATDAGRNELYVGDYKDGSLVGEERLDRREELLKSAELKVITTDAALSESLKKAGKLVTLVAHPGSAGIARRGWEKLRVGERVSPEELEANYIRRSDAEIFAKDRSKHEGPSKQ